LEDDSGDDDSGLRRLDPPSEPSSAVALSAAVPPPLPTSDAKRELDRALAELAVMKVELAQHKAELTRVRRELDVALAELGGRSKPAEPESRDEHRAAPPPMPVIADAAPAMPSARAPIDVDRPARAELLQRVIVSEAPPANSQPPPSSGGRRGAPRRACEFEVEFVDDTHFIAGLSSDLSTGGLFVATYHLIPVGSAVNLAFDLPQGRRIEARGEVRWVRERRERSERNEEGARPGLGIAFTELSDDALVHITEFCRGNPPLYFEV
jgi:uncharacterized protein (TIGR02266 family)